MGGLLEVEAVDAALGSAGTGVLFSTSADMLPSEPHWSSGRSGDKADGSSVVGGSEVKRTDDF